MQANEDFVMDRVVHKYEGPYSNDKNDPGGPTNWGITHTDVDEFYHLKRGTTTAAYMRAMTEKQALTIYKPLYIDKVHFDQLASGKDLCVLDYGINSGVGRPSLVASRMFGMKASSAYTPELIDAINKSDADWFINGMCDERLIFMHGIRGGEAWKQFGGGWGARVKDVRATSLHLAQGGTHAQAPTPPIISPSASGKAVHDNDPQKAKNVATTTAATAATTAAAHATGHLGIYMVVGGVAVVVIGGMLYYISHHASIVKANNTVVLPPNFQVRPPTTTAAAVATAAGVSSSHS